MRTPYKVMAMQFFRYMAYIEFVQVGFHDLNITISLPLIPGGIKKL